MSQRLSSEIYEKARQWLEEDWQRVSEGLQGSEGRFRGKRVLITGAAGFLGFNFLHFFSYLNSKSAAKSVSVIAVDNYLRGKPRWMDEITKVDSNIKPKRWDINRPWIDDQPSFDFIIHCASIASPTFYRQYPLETLDANVLGLRHMLDLARQTNCESFLFFSSSEIYGDPPAEFIPTKESYRGNVATMGPRACYDESKRLGETLCYIYAQQYGVPVKIARPFNNYGPGLRLNDRRVIPDFCREILFGRDIILHSDGSPTRTFCYSSDAITGYLLALLFPAKGEPFNIGADAREISMRDLAQLLFHVSKSKGRVLHKPSEEADYLADNPARRCPDISKARSALGFVPRVDLEFGLSRMLDWYRRFLDLEDLVD
jgi:dTDP-glucose 4,6-dehydratase/UDP-glucuronate decarboxylase